VSIFQSNGGTLAPMIHMHRQLIMQVRYKTRTFVELPVTGLAELYALVSGGISTHVNYARTVEC
jgi:hypothetical protein